MKLKTGVIALIPLVTAAVVVSGFSSRADASQVLFSLRWGNTTSPSATDGQFGSGGPWGIATDATGNVIVADSSNNRVQRFSPTGTFLGKWGTSGTGNGQFNNVRGVAVNSAGFVYVVDGNNHRVQKFTNAGVFVTKWGKNGGDGTSGSGNGEFSDPVGIATDASNNVYVVDAVNNRIQKFTSDGVYITQWGTTGSGDGQFMAPYGIAITANAVFVSDTTTNRIQKFDLAGNHLLTWGTTGSGDGQFNLAAGVATDPAGGVYVADPLNRRIQKFTRNGVFQLKWGQAGVGTFLSPDGTLDGPENLAINNAGDAYVADRGSNRISKFAQFGSITVVQDSQPNDPQDFGFRINGLPFALDDDTDPGAPSTATFSGLATNFYDIEQVATEGWIVTAATCDSSGFPDVDDRAVTVALAPGADVTCTFESSKDFQPDAGIAKAGSDPIGHGIVNDTGANQRITQTKKPKQTASFDVEVVNEGAFNESFTLDADPAAAGFTVKYLVNGTDVTAAVVAGTQTVGPLVPGATELVEVKAKVRKSAVQGTLHNGRLVVASDTLPDQLDVVRARVRVK